MRLPVLILCLLTSAVFARDTTGLSSQLSPDVQEWVRGLRGDHGVPCCDDTDGIDPVWEIRGASYWVKYEGKWLEVKPEALLNIPNRMGVARAWIGHAGGEPFVRCFIAGPVI